MAINRDKNRTLSLSEPGRKENVHHMLSIKKTLLIVPQASFADNSRDRRYALVQTGQSLRRDSLFMATTEFFTAVV